MAQSANEKGLSFLQFVQDLPAPAWVKDMEGRYVYVNAAAAEVFGHAEEAILGRTDGEIFPSEVAESFQRNDRAALRENRRFQTVEFLEDKDGGRRYSMVTTFPLRNGDGTIYLGGTAVDVTEQRNSHANHLAYVPDPSSDVAVGGSQASGLSEQRSSEQLLRVSEDRVKILTDSFADYAILSIDPKGTILTWNPGAANIFGYSDAEIIGGPIHELFTPEDREAKVPEQEMNNASRFGKARDERWHLRKDGSRFYASGVMVPLYVGRELTGYEKIASDLTEKRRQAEELQRAYDEMELRVSERTRELADANKSLAEQMNERRSAERQRILLLQKIVTAQEDERQRIARDLHDQLGQRLTALRLKLTALGAVCRDDPEMSSRVLRIQQVGDLLDSEVSLIAWQLRPAALDELGLVAALETFVSEWSRQFSKNAEFHNSGVRDLRLGAEVETQVYRITQEALNNVAKHSEARRVSVILERVGNIVVLIVEDDGVGFDSESGTTDGTHGLGIPGMKERAELIGASLETESKQGCGTSIYLRLRVPDITSIHEPNEQDN